jgi:hypothetical protein
MEDTLMLVRLALLTLSVISLQLGGLGDLPDELANAIMEALRDGLPGIFEQLADIATGLAKGAIKAIAGPALDLVLYVPSPLPVGVYFQKPANSPWGAIFDYMWGATIPLGFALLFTAWAVGQAGSSLAIIDERKTRKLDRGMFAGLLLIPLSYVLVAIFLQVVNAITAYIAPSPADVTKSVFSLLTFDQLTGSASTLLIAFVLSNTLLVLVLLAVVVNILRIMMLLVISVVLPVLMSLKLAGLPYIDDWADKFLSMYVSLGLSTVIMAAGLRLSLLILGGGKIRLDGIPADNFIGPVFAMIPFALGVVMPAGAILNSLNISQVAGALTGAPAALASGVASKASSKASSLTSAGEKVGRKAGGDKVASKLKEEYSEARRWEGPGDDELGDDFDVGPQTTLPTTYDSGEANLPDTAGGYSAGSADYSATPWGAVGSDASENEDDLLGKRSSDPDQPDDSNEDEGGSETSSESGDSGTQQSDSGATEEGEGATSLTGQQDNADSSSDEESDGEATTDSSSTDSDEESSEETEDTEGPASTRTTVDRVANDPASIPDGEPIDLEQVKYHNKREDGDGQREFLRDLDGNEVPVELSEDGPDLEDGQTYDFSGAQVQGNYLSQPDEELPDAVTNGVIDPDTSEQGRFQSVRVGSSTSVEQSAQSPGEDFKSRVKARANLSKGDAKSAAGRAKQGSYNAVSNAKNKAARSVVDAADDALLTEEARADLGKLPTEIREGTRVQTQHGSRVSTGQVTQMWTDEQTDTEMAAVQFDNQDDPAVVPTDELSLSASSPAGKTTSEGD